MSKTQQTDQFDNDLQDELFDFATAADGEVVTAEIVSVEKESRRSGEKILVTARLPTGKTFRERMPYPKGDTSKWKFVRLAQSCGYSLGSAEHMIGDDVDCRYTDDDDWEMIVPRSRQSRARDGIESAVATLVTPVWLPWGLWRAVTRDERIDDFVDYLAFSTTALVLWGMVGWFILLFVLATLEAFGVPAPLR